MITYPVDGLEIDVAWPEGVDPEGWRSSPDPDDPRWDDDEWDGPAPPDVVSLLGFDPDEEGSE